MMWARVVFLKPDPKTVITENSCVGTHQAADVRLLLYDSVRGDILIRENCQVKFFLGLFAKASESIAQQWVRNKGSIL